MNNRRHIFYILLIVVGLILLFNMIAPYFMQYKIGMGRGMHSRMYEGTSYFIDIRIILFLAIALFGIILLGLFKPVSKSNLCSKCGKKIESEHWKICPICGNRIDFKGKE